MKPSVLLYGPKACGKTKNGAAIAKALGLERVVEADELARATPLLPDGVLYLTNDPAGVKGCGNMTLMHYNVAARAAGVTQ